MNPDLEPGVAAVVLGYPEAVRERVLELRRLLYDVADELEVGAIDEKLRWGEPGFRVKGGTTVRLHCKHPASGKVGFFVPCSTDLAASYRARHPELEIEGDRVVWLPLEGPLPEEALRDCIALAWTYHRRRQRA